MCVDVLMTCVDDCVDVLKCWCVEPSSVMYDVSGMIESRRS
jgi:hypothetical protein